MDTAGSGLLQFKSCTVHVYTLTTIFGSTSGTLVVWPWALLCYKCTVSVSQVIYQKSNEFCRNLLLFSVNGRAAIHKRLRTPCGHQRPIHREHPQSILQILQKVYPRMAEACKRHKTHQSCEEWMGRSHSRQLICILGKDCSQ